MNTVTHEAMKRPSITVSNARRPIVDIRLEGQIREIDLRHTLRILYAVCNVGEPFGVIAKTSSASLTSVQRKEVGAWIQSHGHRLRASCYGIVTVTNSMLVRGIITAILWWAPLPVPDTVVGTMAEAETWLAEREREFRRGIRR